MKRGDLNSASLGNPCCVPSLWQVLSRMPLWLISLYFKCDANYWIQLLYLLFAPFLCWLQNAHVFWIALMIGPSVMWHFFIVLWWLYYANDAAVRPTNRLGNALVKIQRCNFKNVMGDFPLIRLYICSDLKYKLIKRAPIISPFHNVGSSLVTIICCYKMVHK